MEQAEGESLNAQLIGPLAGRHMGVLVLLDFAGEKDLFAVNGARSQRLADLLLVLVVDGGVDQPVAELQGVLDAADGLLPGELPGTEPQHRHPRPARERNCRCRRLRHLSACTPVAWIRFVSIPRAGGAATSRVSRRRRCRRPRAARGRQWASSGRPGPRPRDRKSTRLNSSHTVISYAVFCLKKKKQHTLHNQSHLMEKHTPS